MAAQIQLKRDTTANWTANNPVLAEGEIGIATDNYGFKIGNGLDNWNSLDYATRGLSSLVDGTDGQVLTTDGAGNYTFQTLQIGYGAVDMTIKTAPVNAMTETDFGLNNPDNMLNSILWNFEHETNTTPGLWWDWTFDQSVMNMQPGNKFWIRGQVFRTPTTNTHIGVRFRISGSLLHDGNKGATVYFTGINKAYGKVGTSFTHTFTSSIQTKEVIYLNDNGDSTPDDSKYSFKLEMIDRYTLLLDTEYYSTADA